MTTSGVCGFVSGLLLVYAVRCAVGCGSWTLQQATNCVAVASSSDILSGAQFNTASLTQACQNLSEAVSCVDSYQSACSSSSQYASLRNSIYNLNAIQCDDVMYCLAALATCDQGYPGVSALTPDFSNSDYCQAVLPLISCAQNALEPACAVVSNISYYENLWQDVEFACQHVTCASLGQCITQVELSTFTVGQSGLDHNTCLAYSTYASCLQTALPQCSLSIQPVGQPEAATIARYITEGCTLMSDAGVIYTCAEFSACFENFIGNVSEFSPLELCNVVQGTLGCAVSNAAACAVPSHEVFIRDTNNFMLYIGDRGCGFPQPELSSCTAFADCLGPMVSMFMLQPRPPLVEVCSTLATFQQCAHDMKTSCSLRNSVGPNLGQVASLTRRICTVIGDLSMGTCSQFASCIRLAKPPPFNGATLSTFQWCKLTMTVLQCTLTYSNVCNITDSARSMIMDIYVDAVKVGCTNVYRLTVPPENGANRVTACAALGVAVHLLVIRHLLHSPPGA